MAYTGSAPETWSERALVRLDEEGGNTLYFTTITDSIDLDLGEKGFETISPVSGGRLIKFTPEGDSSVTLELYPVAGGNYWSSSGEEAAGFYDLLHTKSSTYEPEGSPAVAYQALTTQLNRQRYRLTVLWTNDTAATDAGAALVSGSYAALRISLCGYFTKTSPSFTDDVFKVSVTMKVPPFKKAGTSNIQVASTDKSSVTNMTALASFTTSVNF